MEGAGWINLFRRIPIEHHNSIVLMTINGSEIVLQRLLRLEHDFLAVVGRLGGSTEQGKVLLIPYDQLTYLSLSKRLDDAELQGLLGGVPIAPEPMTMAAPAAVENAASSIGSAAPPDRPTVAANVSQATAKNGPPSKSMLLARLRQRLAEDATKQPRA